MSDLEGVVLSDYRLLQCISKGGVADVYRARPLTEGEMNAEEIVGIGGTEGTYEVAVKVFRPGYAQREAFRDYFMTEAEKIGQFDHPNILPFLEYGEGEDLLYLVTPYVSTGTLEDLLRRVGGRFSALQALPIMQQLCSAVQYSHDHDVIHGNIKPSNVFVAGDGRMLLCDFGIARSYDDSQQSLTRIGWGSAEYASPEQSLGVVRRASDIYSLGVLLFRLLTGSPPFTGQTPVEVLLKHVRQEVPSARMLVPTISDAVDHVLRVALQKRSDDRFSSVEELNNAFLAAVTVAPVASPVARAMTRQLVPDLSASLDNIRTPLPTTKSTGALINDPQTPIPAYLTFSSSAAAPFSPTTSQTISASTPTEEHVEQLDFPHMSPVVHPDHGEEASASDVTEIRKRNFLQEDRYRTKSLFWSVDPVEWSPLAKDASEADLIAVPRTADEYLKRNSSAVEKVEPVVSHTEEKQEKPEDEEERDKQAPDTWLKKWLPIIVVILLLLGLLGAVLSAFFFPVDNQSDVHMPLLSQMILALYM